MNVNEEIQDRTIRHMVYLERYKKGEVRKLLRILEREILPDISSKLEQRLDRIKGRGSDPGPSTTARLKQLQKELTRLSEMLAATIGGRLADTLPDFAKNEIEWQASIIRNAIGFDIDTVIPAPRSVAAIIRTTSFAGSNLDEWFDSVARSTQKNIMSAVNRGIIEGETTSQIMRRVRGTKALGYTDGIYQTTRRQVEAVTRTTINHAANQSRIEFFKDNADLLKGMKWISTLDGRTSVTCAGLDGKVFDLDKGPRPPAHPNCRSTMTAVLNDAITAGLKKIPAGTRASMNGAVPASTTYGQWLKRQPVEIQNEVLGVEKAILFRKGGLSIERFTDANLKPLSLEQLRRREQKAFDRAGL